MDTLPSATAAPGDYRSGVTPIWCPGCGDFFVLSALTKALASLAIPRQDVGLVSGIGCSSRMPAYTSVYGFHSIHGRALAIATGLKIARPDLTVLVAGGDGDGLSIGGNHFLHACRRNVDLTYIIMDNQVYGMTKGQASPTTEEDWTKSKLTPLGPQVSPIQPVNLALACGATFVARGFSGDPNGVARLIAEGIQHPGFAVIHVLSPCVTYRAEQKAWKQVVHKYTGETQTNAREASRVMLDDDGFTTGIFLADRRRAYQPLAAATTALSEIEKEFAI
ncbi:MAG: 2-oxoacid:ferredoxin oxidoreductase subunit beta [Azospirillum sp.]|nr:2-oxoacid:ferredoxin oxidoreductase subunit beta [Azospirillum sp.]